MIGIIKKDILLMKNQLIIMGLISTFYLASYLFIKIIVFESFIKDTAFSRGFLSIFPMITIMEFNCRNFQYDHDNRQSERYFNSLPIKRTQMVIAKFISSALFSITGLIISCICLSIFTLTDNAAIHLNSFKAPIIVFLCILIYLALQLPVLVYNGNILASMILPLLLIVIPVNVIGLIKEMNINEIISHISIFVDSHQFINNHLIFISLMSTVLISIISIIFSSIIYNRRDFR